jgi:hypothetical protein
VTGLAPTRRRTLDLAHRLSVAGRGGVTAAVFLEDVCGAVAEAFEFDSVAAVGYDAEAEEVSDSAFAGTAPADHADRQPITGRLLLAEAQETRNLVLVSVPGGATCAFALPLISRERDRLLAFLYGTRSVSSFSAETDADGATGREPRRDELRIAALGGSEGALRVWARSLAQTQGSRRATRAQVNRLDSVTGATSRHRVGIQVPCRWLPLRTPAMWSRFLRP